MDNIDSQINFFNLKMFGFSNDFKKSFKQIKFDERFGLGAIYPSSRKLS